MIQRITEDADVKQRRAVQAARLRQEAKTDPARALERLLLALTANETRFRYLAESTDISAAIFVGSLKTPQMLKLAEAISNKLENYIDEKGIGEIVIPGGATALDENPRTIFIPGITTTESLDDDSAYALPNYEDPSMKILLPGG